MKLNSSENRKLLVCRGPVQSPDIHILSSNSQHLEFVYSRKGQTQDYGPDRRWNNLLYAGDTAFQAGGEALDKDLYTCCTAATADRSLCLQCHPSCGSSGAHRQCGAHMPDEPPRCADSSPSYRVVEEEKMQLVDADNNLLTDVTRSAACAWSC